MEAFHCGTCGQLVFFDNDTCLRCSSPLAYDVAQHDLVVLAPSSVRCANHDVIGCNWLPGVAGERCASCRTTRTTPPRGDADATAEWADAEQAKRRLVAQLAELGLPTDHLAFDLLSSDHDDSVVIGHADGLVTIDVAEADDAKRVEIREQMGEPYRTLLGHFRHETGHGMHDVLVAQQGELDAFRSLFGDERTDYQDAVDRHYAQGPPAGWDQSHVSAYATMHPHEDWAETFAHYLHVRAMLETADTFHLHLDADRLLDEPPLGDDTGDAPPGVPDGAWSRTRRLLAGWLPLSYALNAVNRAMGSDGVYPFVLPPAVVAKFAFVHARVDAVGPQD